MAKIIITRGPGVGEEYALGDSTVVGRHLEADIRVDDLTVSRRHAQINKADHGFALTDLGSGNGTLLNGQRIQDTTPLSDGDEICISNVHLLFRVDQNAGLQDVQTSPVGPGTRTTVRIVDL